MINYTDKADNFNIEHLSTMDNNLYSLLIRIHKCIIKKKNKNIHEVQLISYHNIRVTVFISFSLGSVRVVVPRSRDITNPARNVETVLVFVICIERLVLMT